MFETANGLVRVTQNYQMKLQIQTGKKVDIVEFVLPLLKNNLLSVTDLIKTTGSVLFTETGAL